MYIVYHSIVCLLFCYTLRINIQGGGNKYNDKIQWLSDGHCICCESQLKSLVPKSPHQHCSYGSLTFLELLLCLLYQPISYEPMYKD